MRSIADEVSRVRQGIERQIRGGLPRTEPAPVIEKRLASQQAGSGPLMLPRGQIVKLADNHYAHRSKGAVVKSVNERRMSFKAILSTPSVDKVGDVVIPQGCKPHLSTFALAPTMLWNHQSDNKPIGRWEDDNGELTIVVKDDEYVAGEGFMAQKGNPDAYDIYHLICCHCIRQTSAGFQPIVSEPRQKDYGDGDGYGGRFQPGNDESLTIIEWCPLEFSPVNIACQSEAVILDDSGAVDQEEAKHAAYAADRIASFLSRGRITNRTISPTIRKGLEPFAAARRTQVTGGWTKEQDMRFLRGPSKDYTEGQDIGINTGSANGPQGRFTEGQDIGKDMEGRIPTTINDEDAGTGVGYGGLGRCSAVLLDKTKFPTKAAARRWLLGNNYDCNTLTEIVNGPQGPVRANEGEGDWWMAKQPTGSGKPGSRRIVSIADGVKGVFVDPA